MTTILFLALLIVHQRFFYDKHPNVSTRTLLGAGDRSQ